MITGLAATEETVSVVSRTMPASADGDTTPVTTGTVLVPNTLVAPRTSDERVDPRSPAVITGLWVWLPPGVTIDRHAQLLIRGTTWDVEGEPGGWDDAGIEVAVKRAGT
jgi:hypothetical protein